jgi:WXXGXW repeat (2 copies)
MKQIAVLFMMGTVGLFAVLIGGSSARAVKDKDPMQEGVEVMTRGPMHEAYAAPQGLDPKPGPIVPKAPPERVPEVPPDQKPEGDHVVWIPGYWAWEDDTAEFMWISGFWRDTPPGKRWIPGNWSENSGGWQWTSGFWADAGQTQVNYLPPPPPTLETGPSAAAPDADQIYSPGCWIHVEKQYRWRPGFWVKCRPNWVWTPAHYIWTSAGCVFIEGHWDYELTRRGLLFCPIRFTANVWTRPGFRFTPHFIVYPEAFISALFVRLDYHRYCFGDYFGASYAKHGFIPWIDFRLRANIPLPLFHQFTIAHRGEANWEREFRELYKERRLGTSLRPPRTYVQQQQFLRDLAEKKAVRVGDKMVPVKDVKAAERFLNVSNPITKVDVKAIKLTKLTPEAHALAVKRAEFHDTVRVERKAVEAKIIKNTPPMHITDAHVVGKLPEVPKHLEATHMIEIPKAPTIPAHVEKVVPKYEPPKAPKASPKPLHHGSVARPPVTMMAWIEATKPRDEVIRIPGIRRDLM